MKQYLLILSLLLSLASFGQSKIVVKVPAGNSGSTAWSAITGKPTTVAGYGITDAQNTLVSGVNLKTVNGNTLLGSGDLVISGGGGTTYTTTDNALSISGSNISTKKTWNSITWASSITVPAATSLNHTITLGGNTTITFSGAQDGDIIALELVQDATGSRTVTWNAAVDWSRTSSGAAPTLKTAGGAAQIITFIYKSATAKWYGLY